MTKTTKKDILESTIWLKITIITIIFGMIGIFLITGTLHDIWYNSQEPKNCQETPFSKKCYCDNGFKKVSIMPATIPKWKCDEIIENE